ncbi:hypothetical protein MAP00_003092 [Monascus purpureus]|nr:hypothetical protein MAP00_003092 [Monascus purpureus]
MPPVFNAWHLDILLTEHPAFTRIQSSDSTYMDLKDWHSLVFSAVNADKQSKDGLRVPKPSDEDFKSVCRPLASSTKGRRVKCQPSHVFTLLTEALGVMNIAEWVKEPVDAHSSPSFDLPATRRSFKRPNVPMTMKAETRRLWDTGRIYPDLFLQVGNRPF